MDACLACRARDGSVGVYPIGNERYINDLHRWFLPLVTNKVHVLGSNYFLTSLLPDSYRSCVLTTFCSSIRQSKYTQLALTGGDVRRNYLESSLVGSLLNLVMNTDSGGFAEYPSLSDVD